METICSINSFRLTMFMTSNSPILSKFILQDKQNKTTKNRVIVKSTAIYKNYRIVQCVYPRKEQQSSILVWKLYTKLIALLHVGKVFFFGQTIAHFGSIYEHINIKSHESNHSSNKAFNEGNNEKNCTINNRGWPD